MAGAFGPGSAVFTQTTDRLSRIFAQAGQTPPVAARFREWQRIHRPVSSSETSFIHQTYLALLARLVARRFVASRRPIASSEELLEVVNVDYFSRRGIGNFGEGDLFSWIPLDPRWNMGIDDLVLETVQGLSDALAPHDFTHANPGILDSLYGRTAPRWLAEYVVEDALGMADAPGLSLLDPACGAGTFLCAAIGTMYRTVARRSGDPIDVLFEAPERVRGMDGDPLSVALARLNYLLALGEQVQQAHPPFLVPVYLADAGKVPEPRPASSDDLALTVSTAAGEFPLPMPVIDNPLMLDWLLGRLTNYMDGAQMRLPAQSEDLAVQEVLNAYYNYLTAPKLRTPVPDALTPRQADTLLETARKLVHLHVRGEGTLWLHMVQNLAAPAIFSRAGFDRLAGQGPAALLDATSASYLRPGGRAAMLTSAIEAPPAIITSAERTVRLEIEGRPIPNNSSWADVDSSVRVVEQS